jgi:hypothetical protein
MADTERLDPPEQTTQINAQSLQAAILRDLEARILDIICIALTPRFSIALAVLVILGITQAVIVNSWIAELRTEVSTKSAAVDSAMKQISALESDVVRKGQLEMLERQVAEMGKAAGALNATVYEVRRQQEQLGTNIATVSALTLSVQSKVGEEQDARRDLTEEIKGLAAQLRAGREPAQ